MKKIYVIPFFVIIMTSLTGCYGFFDRIDIGLEVKPGERWLFSTKMEMPKELYYLYEEELLDFFESDADYYRASGIKQDIKIEEPRRAENVIVTFTLSGKGYEKLNKEFGYKMITVDSRKDLIYFEAYGSYSSDLGELFSYANKGTFELIGGKILETNGTEIDNNTVSWQNPNGKLTATMLTPKAKISSYFLISGGIVLVVIAGIKIFTPRTQMPYMGQPVQPPSPPIQNPQAIKTQTNETRKTACVECGTQIHKTAAFCTNCGTKQE